MNDSVRDYSVLEKSIKDILALIKPAEDDRSKRLSTILELENCIHSRTSLAGAAVKPFGSFVSELYSKSGDLDLSVQLRNGSNLPINKQMKQNVLKEIRRALQKQRVPGHMQFIPHARVPVLQYVSNRFGISCDISIDNYAGRIKSKIFYWLNTLDERFGDMVLLIKEWAKARNINDPKNGSLNSYSLCLLVLFHFQTCKPPILPPLKEIYEGNVAEEEAIHDEEHLDQVCAENIARFRIQSKGQINESSLCHLLVAFFQKFTCIDTLPEDVISTYTGQIERIQDNPSWMTKSYHLFVEDPVERPDNAARAVSMRGLDRIATAFNDACCKFDSLEHIDRDELLALLCTPGVGSKHGGKVIADAFKKTPQRNHQQTRSRERVHHDRCLQEAKGFTGSGPALNPQENDTVQQTAMPYQNRNHPQINITVRQTAGSFRNYNRQHTYTSGSGYQTPLYHYQNNNNRQVFSALPQTGGPHQNHSQQVYNAGFQTAPHQQFHTAGFPRQYQSHNQAYATGLQTSPYQSHNQAYTAGTQSSGTFQNRNQQVYNSRSQAAGSYQNQQRRKEYTSNHQTNRHAATARYEPVRGQLYNGSTGNPRSQASNSAASQI